MPQKSKASLTEKVKAVYGRDLSGAGQKELLLYFYHRSKRF